MILQSQTILFITKIIKNINKIEAKKDFYEKNNGFNTASRLTNSDKQFENVCLKYLLRNDIEGLNIYLQVYMETNLNKDNKNEEIKEDTLQVCIICKWMVEIYVNQLKSTIKSHMNSLRQTIRDHKK